MIKSNLLISYRMSRLFKCSLFFLSLIGTSIPLHAKVVFGLDNACQLHTKSRGPFLIQVAAFNAMHSANRLKSHLTKNVHYPIQVKRSGKSYLVLIGPLTSSAMVRKVGCSTTMPTVIKHTSNRSQPHHQNPPQKPRVKGLAAVPLVQPAVRETFPSTLPSLPAKMPHKTIAIPKVNLTGNWLVGADIGLVSPTFNNHMTVNNGSNFPSPENVDLYTTNNGTNPPILGGLIGYRWQRDETLFPATLLALRYQHLFSQDIKGDILQYSLPEFTNYTYTWGMSANVISLYSKIDIAQYKQLMPYFAVGLGASFNNATTYQETALNGVTPRISPAFASQTQTQFAYNVGAGVDWLLAPKWIVSVGYDYQSFGNLSSGPGESTWSATQLNLGRVATNTATIGISYLLDDPFNFYRKQSEK